MGGIVNGGLFYGYDFRSTQPCARVRLKLPLGSLGDLEHVDAWLAERLRVDADALAAFQAQPHTGPTALARGVVDRVLLIYGELARASNLPCFDHGRLIAIEPVAEEAGNFVAVVALPLVDNVPKAIFTHLLDEALSAVLACAGGKTSNVPDDEIVERLDKVIANVTRSNPIRGLSPIPLCRIAHGHRIPFRHLGDGFMRLGIGRAGQLFHKSSLQDDSAVGANICLDKRITSLLLRAAGLPGAEHIFVASRESALEAARQIGWPVVVKPADRERSAGVTAGISDEEALAVAYDRARSASPNVLVERHAAGTCHRILVADGAVFYVVKRTPKRVRGNGRDSVSTLVEAFNAWQAPNPPWKRLKPLVLDELAIECLAADGMSPDAVPAKDEFVYLRPLSGEEWGGAIDDLTAQIHPANAELAIVAARLFGLKIAGVDLITPDIAVPWHANGAIINEMNFRPQLSLVGRTIDASILLGVLAKGNKPVPVHLITGAGDLTAVASALVQRLADAGRRCHSTSSTSTHGPDGSEIPIASSSLFERSLALTMRPDVDEMILIGTPDELFAKGLVVDRFASVHVIDPDADAADQLLRRLQARLVATAFSTSGIPEESRGRSA